jgi:hypothetical protein
MSGLPDAGKDTWSAAARAASSVDNSCARSFQSVPYCSGWSGGMSTAPPTASAAASALIRPTIVPRPATGANCVLLLVIVVAGDDDAQAGIDSAIGLGHGDEITSTKGNSNWQGGRLVQRCGVAEP